MASHPVLVLAGMLAVGLVVGSVACWALAGLKLAAGLPLVTWSDRRPVPWGMLALGVALCLYFVGMGIVGLVLFRPDASGKPLDPDLMTFHQQKMLVWASMALSLGVLFLTLATLVLFHRAAAADLGLSLRRLAGDLRLGFIGFVMLAPPVYLIQGLLVYFWKPSEHPLIEMFKATPDPAFFAVLFLAAAVVAPLFEEFIFRVLLQGFLEKLFGCRGLPPQEYFVGATPSRAAASVIPSPPAAVIAPTDMNPYASPAPAEPNSMPTASDASAQENSLLHGLAALLPIAISSVIFALLHYSHGPDWVPLLFLAAGIGYVYQRTHRVVPGLVVHALLNSASMAGLWIQTYIAPELAG